jgi:hypothetical protein
MTEPRTEHKQGDELMERKITDEEALDQIAAALGLYTNDPSNNPVEELLADIRGYVQDTGRRTDTPEGA